MSEQVRGCVTTSRRITASVVSLSVLIAADFEIPSPIQTSSKGCTSRPSCSVEVKNVKAATGAFVVSVVTAHDKCFRSLEGSRPLGNLENNAARNSPSCGSRAVIARATALAITGKSATLPSSGGRPSEFRISSNPKTAVGDVAALCTNSFQRKERRNELSSAGSDSGEKPRGSSIWRRGSTFEDTRNEV